MNMINAKQGRAMSKPFGIQFEQMRNMIGSGIDARANSPFGLPGTYEQKRIKIRRKFGDMRPYVIDKSMNEDIQKLANAYVMRDRETKGGYSSYSNAKIVSPYRFR